MADSNGIYLGDTVYGALDGIVTTFAVVAGVAGAQLDSSIILILGAANLFADGVSMAAGNYLSKRSESSYNDRQREDAQKDILANPQKHKEEIKEIYRRKGFSGSQLDSIVKKITGDERRWIEEAMISGKGIVQSSANPIRAGATTFAAFVIAGAIPLVSYVAAIAFPLLATKSFVLACILTLLTLFAVGSARSLIIAKSWWRAGTEMLVIGGLAAMIAFLIGYGLRGLV